MGRFEIENRQTSILVRLGKPLRACLERSEIDSKQLLYLFQLLTFPTNQGICFSLPATPCLKSARAADAAERTICVNGCLDMFTETPSPILEDLL
jgi:hypothetical protein